ncbi:MAG TPA: reverse transcriptase-like protein [Candidatus Cybelea sp.]|nr:reverse transcriptase-like protein [Candidatus Cybelea sp.]
MKPPGSPRLFPDASAPPPAGVHIAHIDGASRGNPGPASYAVILRRSGGQVVFELGKRIGRETNNVAEYYALLAALDYAVSHGIKALRIRSDSELLVRQMKGQYRVKSADLKPLYERASKLARQLEYFAIEHVPREMNREADGLANAALDGGDCRSEPPASPASAARSTGPRRTIRAHIANGTLIPSEPLEWPDGTEVVLSIRKP